jgi:NAD(P)-dependent dehydrogenase (short-subunit alcohol dehydrogenase family)
MIEFKGRVVLIAGAASGIGAAVARSFARAGAHVALADIASCEDTLAQIAREGGEAESVSLDVTDGPRAEAALRDLVGRVGALHHVVNCAGLATRHTLAQMPAEAWRRVIEVNLTSGFILIKAAEPYIAAAGGGSVTLISSVAAEHIAYFSGAHYAASKAGQLGLVRHAAFELGRRGIRVNAIGPGPMSNRMGGGQHPAETLHRTALNLPLQQVVEPEDVADACLFLSSPMARAISGVYLPVDAGFLTSRGQPYRRYFDLHDASF